MSTAISMFMNYSASEVLTMEKEQYYRPEVDIVCFHAEDVIATSKDIVEESVPVQGGGSLIDP